MSVEVRIKMMVLLGGVFVIAACAAMLGLSSDSITLQRCVVNQKLQHPAPEKLEGADRCYKIYCWTGEGAFKKAAKAMKRAEYGRPRFYLDYYPADDDAIVCVRQRQKSYWRQFNRGWSR